MEATRTFDGRQDSRDTCFSRVLSDRNYLLIKEGANQGEWAESYRRVFGIYPSQELFLQNAEMAVQETERLARSSPVADELSKRLRAYRDSIPTYFPS